MDNAKQSKGDVAVKKTGSFVIGIDASNIRAGGGVTHLRDLLRHADQKRDGFDSIIVWGGEDTLMSLNDAPWLQKKCISSLNKSRFFRISWQAFSLTKAARAAGCTVLFVPGGSFVTSFKPIVTMSQNMLPFQWRELKRYGSSLMALKLLFLRFSQKRSFRRANGVIFLTQFAKETIGKIVGLSNQNQRIIPHGLNVDFLSDKGDVPKLFPVSSEQAIRVIYVSIVDQYKHQWMLVEAIAKLRNSLGLDIRLDLVGPSYPPALKRLRSAIEHFDHCGEWVNYLGSIDHKELKSLYARADIGVFASTCENFPIILLEMMGAGLPILSSNRRPMVDILGDDALYFDPEVPDSITYSLQKLLSSERMFARLSKASYMKAQSFSCGKCSKDTFNFIYQCQEVFQE